MRLLSPVTLPGEVPLLDQAGADEFYCGLHDKATEKESGPSYIGTNRSDYEFQNLLSYAELSEVCARASSLSKRVYLTMNVLYPDRLLPLGKQQICRAVECGVSAIIISDPAVARWMKRERLPVDAFVSCDATTLTRQGLAFWARFDARRVVLPRQIAVREIARLAPEAKKLGIELEVFVFSGNCIYLDGCCNFMHGNVWATRSTGVNLLGGRFSKWAASRLPARVRQGIVKHMSPGLPCSHKMEIEPVRENPGFRNSAKAVERFLSEHYLMFACGVCSLFDLGPAGVEFVKQIGRTEFTRKKVQDALFIRRMLDLAERASDRESYCRSARQAYLEEYSMPCASCQCLFPEYYPPSESMRSNIILDGALHSKSE